MAEDAEKQKSESEFGVHGWRSAVGKGDGNEEKAEDFFNRKIDRLNGIEIHGPVRRS